MKESGPLDYLSPTDADSIEEWASDLPPLVARNPRLSSVDLVIEGGVGTGRTMVHMMRRIFPNAVYVGMDVADQLSGGRPYLYRTIDDSALHRILAANETPTLMMEGAMIHASCFDFDLIQDIMWKADRSHPLLATFKSLYSLMHSRERNPFEKKKSEVEIITTEGLVSFDNPFMAQIHIPLNEELETAAQQAGWITNRFDFDIGLMILRNS